MPGLQQVLEEARRRREEEERRVARIAQGPQPARVISDRLMGEYDRPNRPMVPTEPRPAEPKPQVRQFRPARPEDTAPPLPVVTPNITPVANLKNRTAMHQGYSPHAAEKLYETPTRVRYGWAGQQQPDERWPGLSGSEGVGGWYRNPLEDGSGEQIHINGQMGQTRIPLSPSRISADDAVLAHEFAHKWYRRELPPETRGSWDNAAVDVARPGAVASVAQAYDNPTDPNEIYAFNAQYGPFEINPQVREHYYEGMYRPGLPPVRPSWMEEPVDAYGRRQGDELGRKDTPFGTEYWVNDRYAPRGYYEDGSPVRTISYPSQWEQPQFPSMRMYQEDWDYYG